MARVYHRDQVGAPALTYSSSGQASFNAIKTILTACLVSGFGGLPSAGWELIAEGADHIVLRNGVHSGYVCFTFSSQSVRVYLAETFSGVSGGVIQGDGVKTGNAAASSLPQVAITMWSFAFTTASSWVAIADDRTFIFAVAGDSVATDRSLNGAGLDYGCFTFYVGEDSSGNFISVGGGASTAVAGAIPPRFSGQGGFTALKDPSSGLLVGANALPIITPGLALTVQTVGVVQPLDSVSLVAASWVAGSPSVVAGRLRGVAVCPELYPVTLPAYAARCLGHPVDLTVRTANTPIDLGDGHAYFARMGSWSVPFWLLTDNPEFW
ncbi:hypothetical protein CXP40_16345 [Pseudomonas sp. YY-1]|nr:hypothetical protein CXP40_16345 [Pseudomonas sp. YY-1]